MKATIHDVSIRHIAAVVPARVETNESLDFDGALKQKVIKNTGIEERRILDTGAGLSPLFRHAADAAMTKLGWEADSVDGLIVVTQTPEYRSPATACVLQHELGLSKEAFAFDIAMGCSGYVYGLYSAMTTLSQTGAKRVLLCVGDAISTLAYPKDKSTRFLFGDAATCTAVELTQGAAPSHFLLRTDGSGFEQIMVPHGGLRHPITPASLAETQDDGGNVSTLASVRMNGPAVFEFTIREVPALVRDLSAFAGVPTADIEAFCCHQANGFMLDFLASKCGIKGRAPVNLRRFGNTSCASIPLLIADVPDQCLKRRAALLGFGVGWSMAAALVDLSQASTSLETVASHA